MPTLERQIEYRSRPIEIRKVGNGADGSFDGEANVFFAVDTYGTIFDPKAFDASLERFLEDGFITYRHDVDKPIGRPNFAESKNGRLIVKGEIYEDMFDGASVLAGMRRGVIKQMSVGFYPGEWEDLNAEQLAQYWKENGYQPTEQDLFRAREGARVFKDVDLEEIAICVRGSNPGTRLTGVRSMLRNLFGLNSRGDMPPIPEEEPEAKMPEADVPPDEPEDETTVDEAEIDAIVGRFAEAIKGVVTEMAKERKKGTKPEPDTTPEETMPSEGTETEDEEEEAAARAILAADYLLADLEIEAALKEGR
jgi:HK97 family phage prohead protease